MTNSQFNQSYNYNGVPVVSFNDSPRKHANPKFIFTLIKQQFSKHVNPIHKHQMFKSLRKFYWRGRIVIKLPLSSTSNFRNENLFFYDPLTMFSVKKNERVV